MLQYTVSGDGPTVTFLHGFTQTSQTWIPVLDVLGSEVTATLIDAPGHGESFDGKRSLVDTATDIAEIMPTGILVGYSMGARMALHVALQSPNKVTALVLISGTAGIDSETDRMTRRDSDARLASRILDIGVPAFVEEWLALPMFAGLTEKTADIPERLRNSAQGLADSLIHAGTGTQTPMWESLSRLTMPVHLIAGESDEKFVAQAQRMHQLIPESVLHIVPNAGHIVHLEQPEIFASILRSIIASSNSEK